jgi:hypothetical protein
MQNHRSPIILAGQLYLDEEKNCYIIVTRNNGGSVSYAGPGFRGMLDDEIFIDRFPPVDPSDVSVDEISGLLSLCVPGTEVKVGFIREEQNA